MSNQVIEDQHFERKNPAQNPLEKGDYENCTFTQCSFSEANLAQFKFIDCVFEECDLSNATITKAGFQDVTFKGCKMLGLRFDICDAFGLAIHFEKCLLDHVSFYKLKLSNTIFKDSRLRETDFTEADLSAAHFENCDLQQAVFDQCNLEKTDFTTAYNFSFDPQNNRMKGAKFPLSGLPGLLVKYGLNIDRNG